MLRLEDITLSLPPAAHAPLVGRLVEAGLPVGKTPSAGGVILWVGDACLRLSNAEPGGSVLVTLGGEDFSDIEQRHSERNLPLAHSRPRQPAFFGLFNKAAPYAVLSPPPIPGSPAQIQLRQWLTQTPPQAGQPNAVDHGIVGISSVEIGIADFASAFMPFRALAGMSMQMQGGRLEMPLQAGTLALNTKHAGTVLTLETTDMAKVCTGLSLAEGFELRILPA